MARHALLLSLLVAACARCAPADPPARRDGAGAIFEEVAAALGIDFAIDRSAAGDYFMPDSMGPGVALLDYDNDGDLDLYAVNGFRSGPEVVSTPQGANRLYRQQRDGRFTDVTAEAGAGDTGYGVGAACGDYDNDGDVDLYVTNYGPDVLYRNNGDGTFTDVTAASGVDNPAWSASAGFRDLDGDGFLDLFVTNYLDYDPAHRATDGAGRPEYAAPASFPGVPDVLYRNDGDGTFTEASRAAGIARPGRGLGVLFTDLDGDGVVDVYVANDGEPNFAWINDGRGAFAERALSLGLAISGHGRPEASMGIAFGDADGDGTGDLLLTHLVQESNTLYLHDGAGDWVDGTVASGLGAASVDLTGFGTVFADAELDGDLDLVVVNGRVRRALPRGGGADLAAHWRPYAEPNQLLLNDGAGRFIDAGDRCGALCAGVEVSRGLAAGDLDGDGALDLVESTGNGTLRVYRNIAPRAGRWLIVRAVDPALRRDAIGALVEVAAGGRRFRRDVSPARSYASSSDPRAHFGLGPVAAVDAITVTWPGGDREVFDGGPADRVVELRRGSGRAAP